MKLLQMLKLTKLRKWLNRQDKEPVVTIRNVNKMSGKEIFVELSRENKVGSMLTEIMNEHRLSQGLGYVQQKPCPASRQATVSLGQLAEFPPTQLRNIQKTFIKEPTSLRYYSDKELDPLLIEWECGRDRGPTTYKKAIPTVLITKRPEYKRKINGKYNQVDTTPVVNSW